MSDNNPEPKSPKRELRYGRQVVGWMQDWGSKLRQPGQMILIGSAGLLWHADRLGRDTPLPEASMDVDPVTEDEAVAELAYQCQIGSDFELVHGWHVNLMPRIALAELPQGWEGRASRATYGHLAVVVPSPQDLLFPKLKRNEPRDRKHAMWAKEIGLVENLPVISNS